MDSCVNISQFCHRDDGGCLGHSDSGVCSAVQKLTAWRAKSADEQEQEVELQLIALDSGDTPGNSTSANAPTRAAVLAAVEACSARGLILPLSQQVDGANGPSGCECGSAELHECRAGKGPILGFPHSVTMRNCYDCQSAALTIPSG